MSVGISMKSSTGCFAHLNIFNLSFARFSRSFSNDWVLNPEEKKKAIERLKMYKIKSNPSNSILKKAAVLIPLCQVNDKDELSLLYTLRKQDLKRHRGQVSFPGGKHDSEDSNLEITALRETEEELGIRKSEIDVWGHGNAIIGKEFKIYPVIGYLGRIDINNLKPNPLEVEFAFTVPVNHFFEPRNCRFTQYRNGTGYVLPVYTNLSCKIWGITALFTHFTVKALFPRMYKHELHPIKPVVSESS